MKLRAFDVFNNSSESALDFLVESNAGLALQHVLNYPNPFVNHTTFHFDHNMANQPLTVQIQIFTISGKLIKTLSTDLLSAKSHFEDISWDGRDEYGDVIGKGVYIYKVKVKTPSSKVEEKFEKLVILN
jgi:flagellar hook assembly protein FlgD